MGVEILVLDKPSKSLNVLPIIANWGSSFIQFVQNKGFVVLSKTVLGAKHNFPWHGVGGVIGLFSALPFSPSPGFFLPSFFSSGITGIRGFRGGTHTEVRLKYWGRSKSGTYREQWETEKILNIFFVWIFQNNKNMLAKLKVLTAKAFHSGSLSMPEMTLAALELVLAW